MKTRVALSLFAGIGGFDLAATWAGFDIACQVEIDPFCLKILAKHWPAIPRHLDIRSFDATPYAGTIDLLMGGPPCQPVSYAGKRQGAEDDRWLWPETLRIMRECRPHWAVFENPLGLLTLNGGVEFERLLSEMEAEGYETQAIIIPACAVGAPHRRDRVWILAHATSGGAATTQQPGQWDLSQLCGETRTIANSPQSRSGRLPVQPGRSQQEGVDVDGSSEVATDADDTGCSQQQRAIAGNEEFAASQFHCQWPTVSPVRGAGDGVPSELDRTRRLKALGNAIVPQVAYAILKRLICDCSVAASVL